MEEINAAIREAVAEERERAVRVACGCVEDGELAVAIIAASMDRP